jgi:hypothetical protein
VTPSTTKRKNVRQKRRAAALAADAAAPDPAPHRLELDPPPRDDLPPVPRLAVAAAGDVRIRDRAKAAGLPTSSPTYGAVIRDFDGDERPDIFLGRHAAPARLYLDRGATFKKAGLDFGSGDRHGCAAADVDGSGLPDLYCSFGGGRGLGVKANQLWLDPGGPSPRLASGPGSAPEPLGRGRLAAFIDVNDDGRKDLFVGQQPDRMDGLPSPNRVYRRDGDPGFRPLAASGITITRGAAAVDVADFDRDGRQDLLFVYQDPRAAGRTSGIRLYRNRTDGLRDVRAAWGIRSIGERDAELVRLDRDSKPDLVQLSGDRIRISLQTGGRFKVVFERSIPHAVAVAAGDADGDGDKDLYVLRQKSRKSIKDLVLFNRGGGRSWRAVKAPSRSGGRADDVYPIDHDQNGLTDFLVLNGTGGKGPVQLISFYR